MLLRDGVGDGFGGDAEVGVDIFIGRAGAEALHADEQSVRANDRVPAEADRSFDGELDRSGADHALTHIKGLLQEQIQRRHRNDAGGDVAAGEKLLRVDRDLDLGSRGEDRRARRTAARTIRAFGFGMR